MHRNNFQVNKRFECSKKIKNPTFPYVNLILYKTETFFTYSRESDKYLLSCLIQISKFKSQVDSLLSGLPWWLRQERIRLQSGRPGFDPWVAKIPWRRAWQPTPVFLPRESPWTEVPDGLQSMGSQRVRHN